jgi:ABC-2 type transport system permease protein
MSAPLIILIILVVWVIFRRLVLPKIRVNKVETKKTSSGKSQISISDSHDYSLKTQLKTVLIFTKLSAKRFMRDRLAQFFAVLFPLIFLFVFGSLTKNEGNVSFKVAVLNQSNTSFSRKLDKELSSSSSTFKVQTNDNTLAKAKNSLSQSQIDGIIVLPPSFGAVVNGVPSGQVKVLYDQTTSGTGQTLTSVLQSVVKGINSKFVTTKEPIAVTGQEINAKGLTAFDYTFSGLLGFSIIGIGIFGPVNVFPELKKQGILRRLHTTPLRVWQYFTATMLSQAITGVASIIIQFIVAIEVFNLKVNGNYLEIFIFTIFSIFMILGLGLAIGGWAKNERQAAPLSNIVVFPMLFLSGTFFPRYVMPGWLQSVTNYLPLTPVIDGLRELTTQGKNLTDIGSQLGLMAVWFIIIYAIAFRVFKWE